MVAEDRDLSAHPVRKGAVFARRKRNFEDGRQGINHQRASSMAGAVLILGVDQVRVAPAWQGVLVTQATVRKSSRPRAGRSFAPTHELALLDPAREACSALPGVHRGLLIVEELAGPIGVPT